MKRRFTGRKRWLAALLAALMLVGAGLAEEKAPMEAAPEPKPINASLPEAPSPDGENSKADLKPQEKCNDIGWYDLLPDDGQGMAIPILYQTDFTETVCTINGVPRSVASSGCGAASVAMVIAYLTGNTEETPTTLFDRAVQEGRYKGKGLTHETLSWMLKENGVQSKWISNRADAILKALEEGKPVIANMGPGIFTERGHYIVLRGVQENGEILVNDPFSEENTRATFPLQTLLKQARSDKAFMVCWVEPPEETAGATP